MKSMNFQTLKLVRESSFRYDETISSVEAAVDKITDICTESPFERILTMNLDSKGHVVGLHEVSRGGVNWSQAPIAEIAKRALLNNASAVILIHNHPSGDVKPSDADITTTEQVRKALALLDIKLIDHMILSPRPDYYSFKREGLL